MAAGTTSGGDSPSADERLREQLAAVTAERRELVVRLLQAQEAERHRIATAIHDDPIQVMVASAIRLEMLAAKIDDDRLREALEALRSDVTAAIDRLRHLIFELEPIALHTQGLAAALRASIEELRGDGAPRFEFADRTDEDPPEAARALLYRAAREMVVNATNHADASRIEVVLERPEGEWLVRVSDDGKGFDPVEGTRVRAGHLGLPSMRDWLEQAGGAMNVESGQGEGTVVEIRLPDDPGVGRPEERPRRSGS